MFDLISACSASTVLSGEIHLRVNNTEVSRKGIIPREELLFGTEGTFEFELAYVVNGVFVAGEVVRA